MTTPQPTPTPAALRALESAATPSVDLAGALAEYKRAVDDIESTDLYELQDRLTGEIGRRRGLGHPMDSIPDLVRRYGNERYDEATNGECGSYLDVLTSEVAAEELFAQIADRLAAAEQELTHELARVEMMTYQRGAIMDVILRLNARDAVDRIDEILRAGTTAEVKRGYEDALAAARASVADLEQAQTTAVAALEAARPVLVYVSHGRRYVGVEYPYPDGRARTALAQVDAALAAPAGDGAAETDVPLVWVAARRRDVDYHHLTDDQGQTLCGRSTRSGVVLPRAEAIEAHNARLCPRCGLHTMPAAPPSSDGTSEEASDA